jgi:hypothetical protein
MDYDVDSTHGVAIQLDMSQVWLGGHLRLDLVTILSLSGYCLFISPNRCDVHFAPPASVSSAPSGSVMHSISSGLFTNTILTCAS